MTDVRRHGLFARISDISACLRDIEPVTKLRAALSRWRDFTSAKEKTDG